MLFKIERYIPVIWNSLTFMYVQNLYRSHPSEYSKRSDQRDVYPTTEVKFDFVIL